MIWFGGLVLTIIGFIFGRVFNQSEIILAEKRRTYEALLNNYPKPIEVYLIDSDDQAIERREKMSSVHGAFLLFAAPKVAQATAIYLNIYEDVDRKLGPDSAVLHPEYKRVSQAHTDLILEMRRDCLAWSAFGYNGKSRIEIPKEVLASEPKK
ncbi:hypothetical protein [Loktanella sp. M215]|uniref:hypothetical protein n=1 Tax=Loktanella sp. M215 TaxID=2675431 RepID=UPI001F16B563|nr:hypothetical protein [Loktanella sp. M215]MCF7698710.1 hypothetical protein [Loktanella sp. M215]